MGVDSVYQAVVIVILILLVWLDTRPVFWHFINLPYYELKEYLGPPTIVGSGAAIWRSPLPVYADISIVDKVVQPISAEMHLHIASPVTSETLQKVRSELLKVPGVRVLDGTCKFRAQTGKELLHMTRWIDKITAGRSALPEPKAKPVSALKAKILQSYTPA